MKFTTTKIGYILLILVFLCSCDPQEDRMSFSNNTNKIVDVELLNLGDSIYSNILPCRSINPESKEKFIKLSSWESVFDNLKPQNLLQVVIYKDLKKNISNLYFRDSLLSIGEYEYRSYSYNDLEKRDWQIKYPDDGFKKGYPIKTTKDGSDEKLLPSPHILKEKGIKDRWNKLDSIHK